MANLIAASSLNHLPGLIGDCGGDPDDVLRRFGLHRDLIGAYDHFVPFTALSDLLGTCASELNTPDFALRLAARQDPDILGPLAIAARNAETVEDALRKVAQFAHVYSPAITVHLRDDGRRMRYEFGTTLARIPHRLHVVELALGVMLSLMRMLSGQQFFPLRVTFAHPAIADEATYRKYFGCPVEFEAATDAVLVSPAVLRQRLHLTDALTYDFAVRYLLGHHRDRAFEDVVSTLVRKLLPTGSAQLPSVAQLLATHPRTVQRTLAQSGTTFDRVVDSARRDLVLSLLALRGVPLSTVAQAVGYAEQSVLTRSCRRWFGVSPLAKRRDLLADQEAPR